jgi:para-nitrobenzyl esterase
MQVGAQGDDCLNLNVFTPALAGRRPVMVWIHGGGFTAGACSQPLYDGGRLTARGDVVVVALNYRLGALGYLLVDGAPPNRGQLDQILALEWVRDNIEAFGGDPEAITIFGESAGGMAVTTLLAMPGARGLFCRAIAQSGAARCTLSVGSARAIAERFAKELGTERLDPQSLGALPISELLRAERATFAAMHRTIAWLPFAPVIDGEYLPAHPLPSLREGAARHVPLLTGTTRDETKLWNAFDSPLDELDEQAVRDRICLLVAPDRRDQLDVDALCAAYSDAPSARDLVDAVETDGRFRIPAIRLCEEHHAGGGTSYMYRFDWRSPAKRGRLGACHSLELPFVFGTLDAPTIDRFAGTGPEVDRLAGRMMDAWLSFARTGDPSHPALDAWPAYDPARRATMIFDSEPRIEGAPMERQRLAWEGVDV